MAQPLNPSSLVSIRVRKSGRMPKGSSGWRVAAVEAPLAEAGRVFPTSFCGHLTRTLDLPGTPWRMMCQPARRGRSKRDRSLQPSESVRGEPVILASLDSLYERCHSSMVHSSIARCGAFESLIIT